MADKIDIPSYGRAKSDACIAAGKGRLRSACAAVILDRGGDNGYWMGILPHPQFQYRRCGALVFAENDVVAYAEPCTLKPKPAGALGLAIRAARGTRSFRSFTWTATAAEIHDISVKPIVHSPYGAYAEVAIVARGQEVRFGLSQGEVSASTCISRLRTLARQSPPFDGFASIEPRTDGVYVLAAAGLLTPFDVLYFDGTDVAVFATGKLHATLNHIRSAESTYPREAYRKEGDWYVSEHHSDPGLGKYIVVLPDDRVLFQYKSDREDSAIMESGGITHERQFVPFDAIDENWGVASATSWPQPDWMPVLLTSGEIEAPNIGSPRARAKG